MPGIDDPKQIDIKKQNEGWKETALSPEDKKKADQVLDNKDIVNNRNFIALTDAAQNDADINIQNTINNIKRTIWDMRENTGNIMNKYWLHLNINYWGNENINKTNRGIVTKEQMKWVRDFMVFQWELKIDNNTYTKIQHLIDYELAWRNNAIQYLIDNGQSDNAQDLIQQKQKIIEQILAMTWITDPDVIKNLDTYNGSSASPIPSEYFFYQSMEGKNELAKSIVNILKNSDTPFEDIKNNFSTASEDQKIQIARMFSSLLSENYKDDWTNPSDAEMANSVKNYLTTGTPMSAWVCRHIHSATAQLLQDLWLEAWLITTNSIGWHAITLWKKEDWSYFFIDYGTMYEGKDLKALQAQYLAAYGSMDLWETISAPNGKVIGFIKTFLEEQVSKRWSASWTDNMGLLSKQGAEQWSLNKLTWQAIDANITTDDNKYASYQYGGEHTQIWIDASQTNSNEWNLTSIGIWGKVYLWKDDNTAISGKITKHDIKYPESGKSFSWSTISISWEKVKNLYTSDNTKINAWIATEAARLFSNKKGSSEMADKVDDVTHESALTIAGIQKIGKNIDVKANIGVREITDFSNERSENMVKPYVWFQAGWAATYNFNKWWNVGVTGEYSTMVGERKFNAGIQGTDKSGKTNIAFNYSKTTPTIAFWEEEIRMNLGLTRNITENAKLYINGSYNKNKAYLMAGFKVNF